jgi:chorismate mutase
LDAVNPQTDRLIQELRSQISDNDRAIVRALNKRVELVARLKRYKESQGIEFVDPQQEEAVLRDLGRANRGPLSQEGLRELYTRILELTKKEVQ